MRKNRIEESPEQRKKRLAAKTVNFGATFLARLILIGAAGYYGYEQFQQTGVMQSRRRHGRFYHAGRFWAGHAEGDGARFEIKRAAAPPATGADESYSQHARSVCHRGATLVSRERLFHVYGRCSLCAGDIRRRDGFSRTGMLLISFAILLPLGARYFMCIGCAPNLIAQPGAWISIAAAFFMISIATIIYAI